MEKFLKEMRDELSFIKDEYLDKEDKLCEKIDDIINAFLDISFTKKRMQTLRKIWKEYKNSKNWHILIANLHNFLKEKLATGEQEQVEFDKNKLKLICVDFVS